MTARVETRTSASSARLQGRGFALGHAIGAPVGAHLANRRKGRLLPSLALSAALFGVEALVLSRSSNSKGITPQNAFVAVAVPVAQVIGSAYIEHRTSRR